MKKGKAKGGGMDEDALLDLENHITKECERYRYDLVRAAVYMAIVPKRTGVSSRREYIGICDNVYSARPSRYTPMDSRYLRALYRFPLEADLSYRILSWDDHPFSVVLSIIDMGEGFLRRHEACKQSVIAFMCVLKRLFSGRDVPRLLGTTLWATRQERAWFAVPDEEHHK
jgi:hypothetical protein